MDLVHRSVFGNACLARFFAVSADDIAGGPLRHFLAAIHPDDVVRVVAAIEGLVDRSQRYRVIYRVRGADRERTILACALLQRGADDAPIAVVGCARELGSDTRVLVGRELEGVSAIDDLAREMEDWLARKLRPSSPR